MKKHSFLRALLPATAILVLASCNSGKEKKEEEKPADTTLVKKEMPAAPVHRLLVRHKVANFNKWMQGYEMHDSARLANGIHSFAIGRGLEDSNMVFIFMNVDDVDKAKAFGTSPDLKEVMKKAGVIGQPTIDIVEIEFDDATNSTEPNRMMVRHHVKDYAAWKTAFDSHKQARIDAGLSDRAIGRSVDNMNDVTVVTIVSDLAKAKAFGQSKDLQDKMKEAGVEGKPDIQFYRIVKKY